MTRLFEGRVGNHYSRDSLKKIYEQGQQRYSERIPPGYEDDRNKAYPYGDLVLWLQIIDYAKSQKKPIIFTIDDSKEDWWRRDKDKKEKILGPRTELIEEIHVKAEIPFHMYLADEFIKQAQKFLKVEIHPGTIKEVKETREQQEQVTTTDRARLLDLLTEEYELTREKLHGLTQEKNRLEFLLSRQRVQMENRYRTKEAQTERQILPAEDLLPAEASNTMIQLERDLNLLSHREQELTHRLYTLQRERLRVKENLQLERRDTTQ